MDHSPAPANVAAALYVASTSYIGGDVVLGDQCTIMHHVVIRGDIAPIRIGSRCNVQDGSVLHTRVNVALLIDDDVAIGHRAVVHCKSVGTRTLIGTGAIILDDVEIGADCIVAAGSVVTPRTCVPDGKLLAGVPARIIRDTTEHDRAEVARVVETYLRIGKMHATGEFPSLVPIPSTG